MHLFLGRRTDEDFTALPFWLMICRCHGRKVDKSSFFERKLTTICNRFWGQASSINKYRDDCQSTARLDFKHCWRIEIDLPFLNYCASAHAWHIFDHKWWESRPIASSLGRKNETAFSNQRWRGMKLKLISKIKITKIVLLTMRLHSNSGQKTWWSKIEGDFSIGQLERDWALIDHWLR